jgi:dTDP-glucose 4,6-dehydratase
VIDSFDGTRLLVTGAGGFIASHLIERLIEQGATVSAFVRYNSRGDIGMIGSLSPDIRDDLEIVYGDLRDSDAVDRAVKGQDLVFHLGAIISIPYSYVHPGDVVATNLIGTMNVLDAVRRHEVTRMVHTSSSEVYGTALRVPIDETHPLQGQSPYSASKIGADKLVESYYRSFDVPVTTLRPFNTYGPRQSMRAVIMTIIVQALTRDRVRLGNLDARRDLTYVADTVAGFLRIAKSSNVLGTEINLGVGSDVTIGELANKIIELTGSRSQIKIDRNRIRPAKSEVGRLVSDNTRAQDLLDWRPTVTLTEGLQKTIDWVRLNLDQYEPDLYHV